MKKLSCKNLGAVRCNYSVEGKSIEEVAKKMMEHAQKAHESLLVGKNDIDRENFLIKMRNNVRESL